MIEHDGQPEHAIAVTNSTDRDPAPNVTTAGVRNSRPMIAGGRVLDREQPEATERAGGAFYVESSPARAQDDLRRSTGSRCRRWRGTMPNQGARRSPSGARSP